MHRFFLAHWAMAALVLAPAQLLANPLSERVPDEPPASPVAILLSALEDTDSALVELLASSLERSPDLALARRATVAAGAKAPIVRALPDPQAAIHLFPLTPETRVGPQRYTLTFTQELPWLAKLGLRERAVVLEEAALRANEEALALELLTTARVRLLELAFLAERKNIVEEEQGHLDLHLEAALAHYSVGRGSQHEVLLVQEEITRKRLQLLRIAERARMVEVSFNTARDALPGSPVPSFPIAPPHASDVDSTKTRDEAESRRPELWAASAKIAKAEAMEELAALSRRPDFKFGLAFTGVGRRDDTVGRETPPEGNGDDILALTAEANIPLRRRRLAAEADEALAQLQVAKAEKDRLQAKILGEVDEHASRLPLLYEQWRVLAGTLRTQAEQSLRSAEAAYTAGQHNAHQVFEAAHVLFEVRVAEARARADHAIALAKLEGAMGAPLKPETGLQMGSMEEANNE